MRCSPRKCRRQKKTFGHYRPRTGLSKFDRSGQRYFWCSRFWEQRPKAPVWSTTVPPKDPARACHVSLEYSPLCTHELTHARTHKQFDGRIRARVHRTRACKYTRTHARTRTRHARRRTSHACMHASHDHKHACHAQTHARTHTSHAAHIAHLEFLAHLVSAQRAKRPSRTRRSLTPRVAQDDVRMRRAQILRNNHGQERPVRRWLVLCSCDWWWVVLGCVGGWLAVVQQQLLLLRRRRRAVGCGCGCRHRRRR